MAKTSMNLDENIAGVLCYLAFWITGIIFYFMETKNKTVRFHALQSILTFLPLWIIAWIIGWIGAPKWTYGYGPLGVGGFDPGIPALVWLSWIIWVITILLWLLLMFKAYNGKKFKVPVIGDIVEKHI
jgi:uncharacterized membrane protein